MTFEREERIAFARILSDLIEADFIVEEDELQSFEKLRGEKAFKISDEMLSEAKRISFADAVGILQGLNSENKNRIKEELRRMSLADGVCAPLEALLIMSVIYALEDKGLVLSIPTSIGIIENMKVLYIENDDNTKADAFIRSHYRYISNEFRLAGFDFVYIPQIVGDFRSINGAYLHKTIKYMMPTIGESRIQRVQNDLCSMTTSRFCYELLYKKMGINLLSSKPAFLIKVGESSVAAKKVGDDMDRNIYSNFLEVPIDEIANDSVLDKVMALMDLYRSMVSETLSIRTRPLGNKFLYYGFHRSLFDLIAYGKERRNYKLVINLKNKAAPLVLRPIDDCKAPAVMTSDNDLVIDMSPQSYSLYILMIYMSLTCNGLDWKDYDTDDPNRIEILKKYNAIYSPLSKGRKSVSYRDKVLVSRIKSALKDYETVVSNLDQFIPSKIKQNKDEYYHVSLPSDSVCIIDGSKGKERELHLIDSEFLKNLQMLR